MSENFNPYAEWLGLQASVTSPNHYQLLGIDESVTDPAAIASAADRAMTRVRACKPGPQAAAWAQLLDRISAAKAVLTDPTQRQSYDQQISAPAATIAAPSNQLLLPPPNNANYPRIAAQPTPTAIDPMAPFVMSPQAVAPQLPQPTQAAAIPLAVPYLQPAAPVLAPPNPMAPVAAAVPMAPTARAVPQASPNPMAPLAPAAGFAPAAPLAAAIPVAPARTNSMQPMAMPAATPMPTQAVPLATAAAPSLDDIPKLKRKPSVKARARPKAGGLLGPVLLGGSVGGLILVVVAVGYYLSGSQLDRSSQTVADVTPAPLPAGGGEVAPAIPRRLDEMPESERPRPTVFTPPTSAPPQPEPTPSPMTEPVPTMTPTSVTPMPAPVTPEPMPDPGPSREEIRALAQSLTTARDAIGELNFPEADREIAKAQAVAKLDEHKAKIGRLQLLREYVGRFQDAIGETLGRVNAGDQVELGNGKTFGIVEKTPDFLIIRVNGANQRFPMTDLNPGLAVRLGEMSLDKASPDTFAMKAAYVSINAKIDDVDRKKVDEWWKEAASVGDVQDLIAAINDDYSLKKDVMEVPLEPTAMAELAARADRLKDARTIEEFAKEFQAAIDESLKTLIKPEMELSIGGSTTVTIKELKTDRVMLTVAEEMRGFQYTKLPLGLAASIAEQILPRDAPLTMVMKGAYFAAREKNQPNKQFRPFVLDWWQQAGEMDQQLQAVIQELVKQYPE